MNTDIRLSVGFFDHPKTIKLERQLGLPGVVALIRLWVWAAQNRPSGVLSGMDEEDIEIAARWNGEQGAFNAVITSLKLLDCVDGIHHIHDWQEHNTWQAEAENRSDASRFSRMAKTFPDAYKALKQAGVKGISHEVYAVITESNDRLTTVERLLKNRLSPFLTSPCLSSPSPTLPEVRESSLRSDSLSGPDGPDEKKLHHKKAPHEPLPEDSEAFRLAVFMRDTLKANLPTLKEPDLQKWARDFDVALRNDERMSDPGFVTQVIKWACSDKFWRTNIHSPTKLREKFDQLAAKMEASAIPQQTTWQSPAQRRVEQNVAACAEAKAMLLSDKGGAGHDGT
jgi:hypothetical protein